MKSILGLKWEQVDFKNWMVNYAPAGRHQTSKRETEVRLNDRAYGALKEALRGAQTDFVIAWDGAGEEHQEADPRRIDPFGRFVLAACLSAYGCGLDGAEQRADPKDC